MLCHFRLNLLTAEVPLEDSPVRAEKDDVRDTLDAVKLSRDLLRVNDLMPFHSVYLGSILGGLRLVPNSDTEHLEPLPVI